MKANIGEYGDLREGRRENDGLISYMERFLVFPLGRILQQDTVIVRMAGGRTHVYLELSPIFPDKESLRGLDYIRRPKIIEEDVDIDQIVIQKVQEVLSAEQALKKAQQNLNDLQIYLKGVFLSVE